MAYKVNYNFQKAERDRAKAAKKEAKLREKQAGRAGGGADADAMEGTNDEAPPPSHDAASD